MRQDRIGLGAGAAAAALLLAAGLLAGCRRIAPEGPLPLPPPARVSEPVASVLSAPLAIPLAEVDSLLDRLLPQQLYAVEQQPVGKGLARARLDLTVRRNGRVRLETRSGALLTAIPLRVDGRVHKVKISRPFTTTFVVHARSELRLDRHWRMRAQTRSEGYTWETTPSIRLLGFTISLEGVAGRALEKQLAALTPRIDSLIAARVTLRPQMERLWESLKEPIPLQRQPPVWLHAQPTDAYLAPAESRGDTLFYRLRLHALLRTSVGSAPPTADVGRLPPLRPLPDTLAADAPARFQVHVPLTLSYADANALLARAVAGRGYTFREKVAFEVTGLQLYGHGPSLVARLDFRARMDDAWYATRGRVFMTGRPHYDADSETVRVDSFTYDVASQDALVAAADWALRERLLEQVRDRLALPVRDRLDTLQVRLQQALDGRALGQFLVLSGKVDALKLDALYLTPDGIGLDVKVEGDLGIRLRSLAHVVRPRRSRR